MNTRYRFDRINLRRALGVAAAVTMATCALLAVVGLLPAAQPRLALAQGVSAGSVTHTLVSDFQVCTVLTSTINRILTDTFVSSANGGELRLAAYLEDYFDGTQVDTTKWLTGSTDAGAQRPIVGNGIITFDNTLARSLITVPMQGRYAEIRARFAISVGNGDIGFGRLNQPGAPPPPVPCPGSTDCDGANRLFISLGAPNEVYANGRDGYEPSGGPINTLQTGLTFTEFHQYRIEWNPIDTLYYVDGVLDPAATFTSAASITYTPYVWLYTDHFDPPRPLEVDWIRVLYYPAGTGQYQSCAIDSAQQSSWTTLTYTSDLPAGTSATFETRSSSDGVTWNDWAAAGASGSTIPSPNGRFLQYRVTLSTTDVNASPEIGSVIVSYELNEPPTADAGGPYVAAEGTGVSLDGSGSSDPNGDTLVYEWDLNYTGAFDVDASGVSPVVTFPDGPATPTIALRVRDESGLIDVQTTTVTVNNVAPTASAGNDGPIDEASPVTITAGQTDPGADTFQYQFDCDNNGSFEIGWQTGNTTQCTFNDDTGQPFTVGVQVRDDDGGVSLTATTGVSVTNVAPTASAGNNGPVDEGSPVAITAGQTDPGADTFEYQFDCDNNGSFEIGWQTGDTAPCTFNDDTGQPFTVGVQVRDDDGGVSITATTGVSVNNVSPAANIGPDLAANEGSLIAFTAVITDPGADTFTYLWDFGDGLTSTLPSPNRAYADNGVYTATLTVFDDDGGGPAIDEAVITVDNVNPIVDIGPDLAANEGSLIAFTAVITDPGADTFTYLWDFGDGLTSTLPSPNRAYADNGAYTATLTVFDDDGGGPAIDQAVVTVSNVAPTASAGNDGPVDEGSPATITASQTDPGTADTFQYRFDCGNDGTYEIDWQAGNTAPCTFFDNGTFTVRAQVRDDDLAESNEATTPVTVTNVAPSVSTTGPYTGDEGSLIAFTGNFSDPGSADTHAFLWNFGDGVTSTLQSPSHTYADDGLFTAVFTATDDDGGFNFASTPVTVANVAPSISITTTGSVFEGSPATVVATVTDPGLLDTFTYWYDCTDDGVYENGPTSSNTALCLYLDDTGGPFSVRVRVDDKDGGSTSITGSINVLNVSPVAGADNNGPVNEGSPVTITADQTDPGANDTFEYRFDCGDDGVYEIDWQSGTTAECTFDDDGGSPFNVRVQVRDDDGGQSSPVTTSVSVNNVAPIASTTGPYTGGINRVIAFTGVFTDAGSGDTHTFLWDFGDGVTSTLQSPGHTYTAVGDYTVVFTVTDDDGGVGVATTMAAARYLTFLPLIARNASGGGASQAVLDSAAHFTGQITRLAESAWRAWIITEKAGIHTSQQRREGR